MKVLIVDDNQQDRRILRYNLEHHDCEVIEASDGDEALALARSHSPSLIISDALMPRMDGFQLLRAVKTDDALRPIPFVFYSAVYTGHDEAMLAVSLGAEAFMIKPKEPEEFWAELREIMDGCALRGESSLSPEIIADEEEYLRQYSQIVATKLEEKVRELEAAKARIESSERCYRNLYNSLRDVVVIADSDRMIVDVNQPAMRDLFGYETEEVRGRSTRILYADEETFLRTGMEIFSKREYLPGVLIQTTFMRKNGEPFHAELFALKLIGDDGLPSGNIGVIRDITERRRAEEERRKLEEQIKQAQKMEAVGQLAGGIAHDFNNILTAIIGYASILKMKMDAADPLRTGVDQILSASEEATNLTQSLLAFSRKRIFDTRPVDLNEIIRGVEKLLRRLISEDIELRTALNGGELTVMVDRSQIEQVLINLATNARDAMPEGGALTIGTKIAEMDERFVKTHGYGMPGRFALITVTDTGAGMDEETRLRIFDPFFTTKEVGQGTGLGLATAYGIVKQHEGFINVYSEEGRGTTFKIYLPLSAARAERPGPVKAAPLRRGTETILVAEDDPVLRELGYTVILAEDGEVAVMKYREHQDKVALLLLDVVMPKKNGREVIEEIRKERPDAKALFVSGYTADILQKKGVLSDGLYFIMKPLSPWDLSEKVREILDRRDEDK